MNQRIITRLYPIIGLDLEPDFVEELFILPGIQRNLTYLLGKSDDGSVLLEGTTSGALKVADTGSGFEAYTTETGTCADAYAAGQTHEYVAARSVWDFKLDTTDADVQFQNSSGSWGDTIWYVAGQSSIEVSAFGVRLRNHTGGDNTVYQVVSWY
jgi:hypothetical protein